MTDAIGNNSILNDLSVRNKNSNEDNNNELGQRAFLKLMITQLENQDPLSPQENTEFIAQLAQFSSVESLDQLNNQFTSFSEGFVANQALQASTLVGRSVTVPSDRAQLNIDDAISGVVEIPASSNDVSIKILDETGVLAEQINLGSRRAGPLNFRWNGESIDIDGQPLDWQSANSAGRAPGNYQFLVSASIDGKQTQLGTALSANVNSVTVGKNGSLTLNLSGAGEVNLADIKQFNE